MKHNNSGIKKNINPGWKMTRMYFSNVEYWPGGIFYHWKLRPKVVKFIHGVIFQRFEKDLFLNSNDLDKLNIDPVEKRLQLQSIELELALPDIKVHIYTWKLQFLNFNHCILSDTYTELDDFLRVDLSDCNYLILKLKIWYLSILLCK